jgi:hypothetical protein
MTDIAQKDRNTNAKTKKNHASGDLGITNPHAELALGL